MGLGFSLGMVRLHVAVAYPPAFERGERRWNVILAWHGQQHLGGGLRRQQLEDPASPSTIQLGHRIVEQQQRL